jgi:pyruvate formate lyase activating enzyme
MTDMTDTTTAAASTSTFPLAFCDRLRMATDGAGVTALVGAFGCPLRCKLCINPQTWHKRADGKLPFTRVTPAELYDKVKIDSLYYLATGGGVTFGGGEPLLHTDFITAFRHTVPKEWRIYAESCLNVPEANVRTAAQVVDHFFIDVKDMDPAIYKAYTERYNTLVKENLSLLLSLVGADRITVRVPHIPGFNTDADVEASVRELKRMGVTHFDVFTYKQPTRKV